MINLVSGLQDIYYRYIQFLEIPNDFGNTCVQCKLDFFQKEAKVQPPAAKIKCHKGYSGLDVA